MSSKWIDELSIKTGLPTKLLSKLNLPRLDEKMIKCLKELGKAKGRVKNRTKRMIKNGGDEIIEAIKILIGIENALTLKPCLTPGSLKEISNFLLN